MNELKIICKRLIIVCFLLAIGMHECVAQKNISETQKEINHKMDSIVRAKGYRTSRISAVLGLGFGFKHTELYSTTNGSNATLSGGGGIHLGLEIGAHIIKQVELAVSVKYELSSLSVPVNQVSAGFQRIPFTPAAYYDIRIGKQTHVNIGTGCGIYFKGLMVIDDQFTPIYIEASYKTALSPIISANFQLYFNRKLSWSMQGGLLAYFPNYKLKEFYLNGGTYPANDPRIPTEFVKWNGSGIDFSFGISYHFL